MKVIEYLKENQSAMRLGVPIELKDLIDDGFVHAGSYESLLELLDNIGMEHVKNATFVLEDIYNDQNRIMIYYVKEIEKYDEFDLRQFAAKVKRLEKHEASLDEKIEDATQRSSYSPQMVYNNDFVK